jgi:hypothetical protein
MHYYLLLVKPHEQQKLQTAPPPPLNPFPSHRLPCPLPPSSPAPSCSSPLHAPFVSPLTNASSLLPAPSPSPPICCLLHHYCPVAHPPSPAPVIMTNPAGIVPRSTVVPVPLSCPLCNELEAIHSTTIPTVTLQIMPVNDQNVMGPQLVGGCALASDT